MRVMSTIHDAIDCTNYLFKRIIYAICDTVDCMDQIWNNLIIYAIHCINKLGI